MRARAPIGTTSSTPVKAVPPGVTVVGSTSSVVVVDLWIVVGPTVGEAVVVVVVVVVPLEGGGDELEGGGDELEGGGDELEGGGDELEGGGDVVTEMTDPCEISLPLEWLRFESEVKVYSSGPS